MKNKERIEALENRIEALEKGEQPLVKKTDENLNSDESYLSEVKQPDWENLLDLNDIVDNAKGWVNNTSYTQKLNFKIHERIKPLLDDIKNVREWYANVRKARDNYHDSLIYAQKRIAELEAENKKLDNALGDAQWSSNDFEWQLMEAKKQISAFEQSYIDCMNTRTDCHRSLEEAYDRIEELELVNKTYKLSIPNRKKSNQINVPFEIKENFILFKESNSDFTSYLSRYCKANNIDPNKVERITLTMSEEE